MWRRGVLAVLLALGGCGFHPLYRPAAGGAASPAQRGLEQVQVGLIAERPGQLLRLALQRRFEDAGESPAHSYDLAVSLNLGSETIGIEQDTSATRTRVSADASWVLTAQDPQRTTLASGSAHALDGYNVIANQFFASDQENDEVQRRMMEQLADKIALQLGTYFDRAARRNGA